jgi:hypothetical protein
MVDPLPPPVPLMPKAPVKDVAITSRANLVSSVETPPDFHRGVTWEYEFPMPVDNIAFDVEASTNLFDWYLVVTTNEPPVNWIDSNPTEYVRCGAHWIVPIP